MPTSPKLRIGPAGWDYPSWQRLLYPNPRPRGFHPLQFLAGLFDAVEINTSFYRPLRPELARLWASQVASNPEFRFTAKLGRRFTHERVLEESELREAIAGFVPLQDAGRLGCLLMQFPWSFRFTAENRDLLIRLRRAFHEFPLAAEMRHESWMAPEALGVLVDYHIGFVNIDQPRTVRAMPPTSFLTTGTGYVRLHGRLADPVTRAARSDYMFSLSELEEWKARIQRFHHLADSTYVVFNNNARARSAVNALQLECLLGGTHRRVPPALSSHWRVELASYPTHGPVQRDLFEQVAA